MKTLNVLVAIPFLIICITGCRKTEDDPLLSLRSRKARLTGSWDATNYYELQQSFRNGLQSSSSIVNGDGSKYYSTQNNNKDSGILYLQYTFKRDGSFEYYYKKDQAITTVNGNWDFNEGVGKEKSKTRILLTYKESSFNGTKYTYDENNVATDQLELLELRNNKMIVSKELTTTTTLNNGTIERIVFISQITLEQ